MIRINNPYILEQNNKTRLCCNVIIEEENNEELIWLEVENDYKKYLTTERGDAFLILMLPFAMLNNIDIELKTPVTEELLYHIREYILPSLVNHSDYLFMPKIYAQTCEALPNEGAVGTGFSRGVDSLHAIASLYNSEYKGSNLTHLCLFHTDIHNEKTSAIFEKKKKDSYKIANELGLPLVVVDTNCYNVIRTPEDYNYLHEYSSMFVVYALQKLWKQYYYASWGGDFSEFSVANAHIESSAHYELLLLSFLSKSNLRLYPEGGAETRVEKVKKIKDFELAKKYLHVCLESSSNCSKCSKCMLTMMNLDSLGVLNHFSNVFDIDYFKNDRNVFLEHLFKVHKVGYSKTGYSTVRPIYEFYRNDPHIKELVAKDEVWGKLEKASGLYDDGWLEPESSITVITGASGKLNIYLYLPDNIEKQEVCIYLNDYNKFNQSLIHGINCVTIDTPKNYEITIHLNFSNYLNPSQDGLCEDIRNLSAILSKIELE